MTWTVSAIVALATMLEGAHGGFGKVLVGTVKATLAVTATAHAPNEHDPKHYAGQPNSLA